MKRSIGLPLVLALAACASPTPTRSGAAENGTFAMAVEGDARSEARAALARDARRRQERMLDVLEPGRALASMRLEDEEVAAGLVPPPELFAIGGELFHHRFLEAEGGAATLSRLEGTSASAVARRCASCHFRGGAAGGGSTIDAAYVGGDGEHFASAVARRAPSLAGSGWIELAAGEMTRELERLREATIVLARERGGDVTTRLATHGVSFGVVTAHSDGTLDVSGVEGIDADLVVRPFGAQGDHARVASMVDAELTRRLGLGTHDEPRALSGAQRAAIVAYVALVAPPIEELPVSADGALAAARGRALFDTLGCAGCHLPELAVESDAFDPGVGARLHLAREAEPPRLAPRASDGALVVRAYSDLRRHAMGAALADPHPVGAAPADTFVTPPLWALAARAPYLHDGRAAAVEDAILAHGGEAQSARDAYGALDDPTRGDLRLFLTSLTRARRLEVE